MNSPLILILHNAFNRKASRERNAFTFDSDSPQPRRRKKRRPAKFASVQQV
jgi:hypothetical protein